MTGHRKRIVLTTNADFARPRKSANLVTIRPDGSGLKRLTRFTGGEHGKNAFAGSFSPNGKRIVFRFEKRDKAALATIGRNGRHLRLLAKLSKNKPRYIDWGTAPQRYRFRLAAAVPRRRPALPHCASCESCFGVARAIGSASTQQRSRGYGHCCFSSIPAAKRPSARVLADCSIRREAAVCTCAPAHRPMRASVAPRRRRSQPRRPEAWRL
jgi:hypothetical protein